MRTPSQVEKILRKGQGAASLFCEGDLERKRRILNEVLLNATVEDGRITSYQWKSPFDVLEVDSEGALLCEWWALEDLNLWPLPRQGSALPLS
jgi:hypothetical protein